MRSLIVGLGLACLQLSSAAAPVPKERAEAEKVVGVWKLVKTSKMNSQATSLEMELTASGKMILRQSFNGGKPAIYQGEYKVIKNELPYSVSAPNGYRHAETLTIKKLTDTELVVVDPDGIQEDFERIKPKKPEEAPLPRDKKIEDKKEKP